MGMKIEIEEALHAHALWRKQFKDFLNGRGSIEIAKVNATDQCIFGKWLNNEGYRMIPSELYDEICTVHKEFHQTAAGIIQKIKEKRFAEAREDISQDGALNQVSLRLNALLLKLSLRELSVAVSTSPQKEQPQGLEDPPQTFSGESSTQNAPD